MSEKKEAALVLTGDEIVKALRCCATDSNSGGGCRNCPLDKRAGRLECSEMICLMAADRIGELQEELRKLRDAAEGICQTEITEMIRLAKECNTALERGLHGASDADFAKITEHQQVLSGLGRGSVVHAEPTGEHGWRVEWIHVEGAAVFEAGGGADAEGG